ncbi:MAG: HAMP domain-containing histidine kinase [Planctomycetaceae bacterium]|nr:HAMP domain-containing histidine kinase [Planctomycetaceae bacterium]
MFFARLNNLTKTLRFRITVWNVVVIVLTAVATLIGVRHGVQLAILQEMDQILIEDLYEIEYKLADANTNVSDVKSAAQSPKRTATRQLLEDLNRKARGHEHHGWFVQLRDEKNQLLWASEKSPENLPVKTNVKNFQPRTFDTFRMVQNRETTGGFSPLIVRVGSSTDFLDRDMNRIDYLVALATGIVLLLAPPVGYWLSGRATRPIGNINRTAARLRPNHMEERLPIRKTNDEVDQLARTINSMLDRIADYLAQRRDFLANSAHELRSPIAAIRSTVEVALGSERTTQEYQNLLFDVIEECESLESLVNQLLLLAETENLSLQTHGRPIDLSQLVERACDMFQAIADSRNIALETSIQPEIVVTGHEHHLRQVLNNLIDNALKFTPQEQEVQVQLHAEADNVELIVEDTGMGIPADDLPRIFERFFRGDRAHSRGLEIRGTGLGLSICQGIVEAHCGRIFVTSEVGKGTKFTVILPRQCESTGSHQEDPLPNSVAEIR